MGWFSRGGRVIAVPPPQPEIWRAIRFMYGRLCGTSAGYLKKIKTKCPGCETTVALPVVSDGWVGEWWVDGGWLGVNCRRGNRKSGFTCSEIFIILPLFRDGSYYYILCAYILLYTYTANAKHRRCFIVNPPKQTDLHFSRAVLKKLPPLQKNEISIASIYPRTRIPRYPRWSTDGRYNNNTHTYLIIQYHNSYKRVVSCSLRVFATTNTKNITPPPPPLRSSCDILILLFIIIFHAPPTTERRFYSILVLAIISSVLTISSILYNIV